MRTFEPATDNKPYTFVDRPKISIRIVSLLVWSVSGFLLYKSVVEPPAEWWARWGILAVFALCCCSVIHEFMLRPTRVTTIRAAQRQVVVQETAPWRTREVVVSIPPGSRFEIFECDSDNSVAHGVRIKPKEKGWLTVAEFLSKEDAEFLASDANSRLLG